MKKTLLPFLLILSFTIQAHVTEEFPSARKFYHTLMKKAKPEVIGISFFVALVPLYGWAFGGAGLYMSKYFDYKQIYFALKSSHVLANKNYHSKKQILQATKRLNNLLSFLKKSLLKEEKKQNKISGNHQKKFNRRLLKWEVSDLVIILNQADECFPLVLGDQKSKSVVSKRFFIYSLITTADDTDKSILEIETEKEKKENILDLVSV